VVSVDFCGGVISRWCYLHYYNEGGSPSVNDVAIPVTGHGGPYGCETSRLPHFLDRRPTEGGKVSLTHLPPFTPRKIAGTHFC
jgi:hypothetical protein